jgi:CheY-like chemotaxis protein
MMDGRRRILVIDDAPEVREAILAALDPIRFRVTVAGRVPTAANRSRVDLFDLIVCARVDTLASFRANTRDLPEIPVLVLTRDARTRPWSMTTTVRFARRPAAVAELRELVTLAAS